MTEKPAWHWENELGREKKWSEENEQDWMEAEIPRYGFKPGGNPKEEAVRFTEKPRRVETVSWQEDEPRVSEGKWAGAQRTQDYLAQLGEQREKKTRLKSFSLASDLGQSLQQTEISPSLFSSQNKIRTVPKEPLPGLLDDNKSHCLHLRIPGSSSNGGGRPGKPQENLRVKNRQGWLGRTQEEKGEGRDAWEGEEGGEKPGEISEERDNRKIQVEKAVTVLDQWFSDRREKRGSLGDLPGREQGPYLPSSERNKVPGRREKEKDHDEDEEEEEEEEEEDEQVLEDAEDDLGEAETTREPWESWKNRGNGIDGTGRKEGTGEEEQEAEEQLLDLLSPASRKIAQKGIPNENWLTNYFRMAICGTTQLTRQRQHLMIKELFAMWEDQQQQSLLDRMRSKKADLAGMGNGHIHRLEMEILQRLCFDPSEDPELQILEEFSRLVNNEGKTQGQSRWGTVQSSQQQGPSVNTTELEKLSKELDTFVTELDEELQLKLTEINPTNKFARELLRENLRKQGEILLFLRTFISGYRTKVRRILRKILKRHCEQLDLDYAEMSTKIREVSRRHNTRFLEQAAEEAGETPRLSRKDSAPSSPFLRNGQSRSEGLRDNISQAHREDLREARNLSEKITAYIRRFSAILQDQEEPGFDLLVSDTEWMEREEPELLQDPFGVAYSSRIGHKLRQLSSLLDSLYGKEEKPSLGPPAARSSAVSEGTNSAAKNPKLLDIILNFKEDLRQIVRLPQTSERQEKLKLLQRKLQEHEHLLGLGSCPETPPSSPHHSLLSQDPVPRAGPQPNPPNLQQARSLLTELNQQYRKLRQRLIEHGETYKEFFEALYPAHQGMSSYLLEQIDQLAERFDHLLEARLRRSLKLTNEELDTLRISYVDKLSICARSYEQARDNIDRLLYSHAQYVHPWKKDIDYIWSLFMYKDQVVQISTYIEQHLKDIPLAIGFARLTN